MLPVAGILLSPHVFLYDVVVSMTAVPVLAKRVTWLSMPLLVGGFSVVFVSHLVVQNPAATVLWHLLALVVVLLAPPVKKVRLSMN
jgi:hypothetical protein